MSGDTGKDRGFTPPRPNSTSPATWRRALMVDILLIVLGTGGILVMAAYAALCERI
jgi:hypothetical protein